MNELAEFLVNTVKRVCESLHLGKYTVFDQLKSSGIILYQAPICDLTNHQVIVPINL